MEKRSIPRQFPRLRPRMICSATPYTPCPLSKVVQRLKEGIEARGRFDNEVGEVVSLTVRDLLDHYKTEAEDAFGYRLQDDHRGTAYRNCGEILREHGIHWWPTVISTTTWLIMALDAEFGRYGIQDAVLLLGFINAQDGKDYVKKYHKQDPTIPDDLVRAFIARTRPNVLPKEKPLKDDGKQGVHKTSSDVEEGNAVEAQEVNGVVYVNPRRVVLTCVVVVSIWFALVGYSPPR